MAEILQGPFLPTHSGEGAGPVDLGVVGLGLPSSVVAKAREELVPKIARDLHIRQDVVGALFDVAFALKRTTVLPERSDIEALLKFFGSEKILRSMLRSRTRKQRLALAFGPDNKIERYMEARIVNLLRKKMTISARQLAREAEFYFHIPKEVALPVAKRVRHRLNTRQRRFRSPENVHRIFRRYSLQPHDFTMLSAAGVITAATGAETLQVLGASLAHLYGKGRLKIIA